MAAYSIVPVESPDLSVLSELLLASKLCLTVNRLLWKNWPNEAFQKINYTDAIESGFKSSHTNHFKAVDASGEILGFIVFSKRRTSDTEASPEQQQEDEHKPIADQMDPKVLQTVMKAVEEVDKEVKGKDHLELTYVYVRPSYRSQGIGSKLVQLGFDKSKAEGLPILLGSEPEAHEFFIKLGFKDTRHADMDLGQLAPPHSGFGIFRLWGMAWEDGKQ